VTANAWASQFAEDPLKASNAGRHGRRLVVVNAKFDTGITPTAHQREVILVDACPAGTPSDARIGPGSAAPGACSATNPAASQSLPGQGFT